MSSIIRNRAANPIGSETVEAATPARKQPDLLAQFPDLDGAKPVVRSDESREVRIQYQAMAIRLLLGVSAIVMVALVASLLNRSRRPAVTVAELPAWRSEAGAAPAPMAKAKAPAASTASAIATSAAAIANAGQPAPAKHADLKPAKVANSEPTRRVQPAIATTATAPVAHPADFRAADNRPADNRSGERNDNRNYDRPGSGPIYQADTRNDVAAPYRPTGGNNYNGTQPAGNAPANQYNPYLNGYNNAPTNNGPVNGGAMNNPNMYSAPTNEVRNLPPVGPQRGDYAPANSYGPNNYQPNNAPNSNAPGNYPPNNYVPNNNPQYAPQQYGPTANQAPAQYAPSAAADPYARGEAGVARFDGTVANPNVNSSTYPPNNSPMNVRQ